MTDPIERRIGDLKLPDPTPDLDRRINELLCTRKNGVASQQNRRFGLLVLAGGTLAAGMLGLVLHPSPPTVENKQTVQQRPAVPVVETIKLSFPSLDLSSAGTVNDQDELFPTGTIVVSTSIQKEE